MPQFQLSLDNAQQPHFGIRRFRVGVMLADAGEVAELRLEVSQLLGVVAMHLEAAPHFVDLQRCGRQQPPTDELVKAPDHLKGQRLGERLPQKRPLKIEVRRHPKVVEVAGLPVPRVGILSAEPGAELSLIEEVALLIADRFEIEAVGPAEIENRRAAGRARVFDALTPRLPLGAVRPGEFKRDESDDLRACEILSGVGAGICIAQAVAFQFPRGSVAGRRPIVARRAAEQDTLHQIEQHGFPCAVFTRNYDVALDFDDLVKAIPIHRDDAAEQNWAFNFRGFHRLWARVPTRAFRKTGPLG